MENESGRYKGKIFELSTRSPGKVLICGGYLIINPKYRGLVLTTKTYFKSQGRLEISDRNEIKDQAQTTILIVINSKNFNQSFFYKADISINKKEKGDLAVLITFERLKEDDFLEFFNKNYKTNKFYNKNNKYPNDCFIINSLKSALYYLILYQTCTLNQEELISKFNNKIMFLNIELEADYRFYGCAKDFEQLNIANNIKTGLGSSSALVSSLTSNIILIFCQYFNQIEIKSTLNDYNDKTKLCLLLAAINANNQAQNKIGSGFDICSCLLGSNVFKRKLFDQEINENFNHSTLLISQERVNLYNEIIIDLMEERYLENIVRIPKSFFEAENHYAIISIEIGTDTRSFVKKIMEYANKNKKNEIFDDDVFQEINNENEDFIQYIINEETEESKLKIINNNIRSKIKHLSLLAETEIEPNISSEIIDAVLNKGLSFGVCPGAGGYDGIFVFGHENQTYEKIKEVVNTLNEKYKDNININFFPIEITEEGILIN